MTDADLVVIGASPAMLVDAVAASAAGQNVVVFDGSDRPGGAWSDGDVFDRSGVELGCHYLFASPRVYRLLELVGVRLERLDPQPVAIFRQRRLPIAAAQTWGRLFETIGDADREGIIRELQRLATYRVHRYPPDGCGGLVRDLVAALTARAAQLRLGTSVEAVDVNGRAVDIHTTDGSMRARQGVLNDSVRLGGVTVDGTWLPLKRHSVVKDHVLLELDRPPRTPFTYAEVLGRSAAKRLSRADWSGSRGAPAIVCAELYPWATAGLDPAGKAALAHACLVQHGLVARDTVVVRHELLRYHIVIHDRGRLDQLERAAGRRLRILRTREDLGDSLRPQARRLERELASSGVARRRRAAGP